MIDWADTANWGGRVHEASNGSWMTSREVDDESLMGNGTSFHLIDAEERAEQ